jgi:sugar phosphate isomerase/epimerase
VSFAASGPAGPKFGLCPFTTIDCSFEQDLEICIELGVGSIDVLERKLSSDVGAAREQLQRLAAATIEIASFVPRVHAVYPDSLNPQPIDREVRRAMFEVSLARAVEIGIPPGTPVLSVTGAAPGVNLREAAKWSIASYRELADLAGHNGLSIVLEPLHPMFMNTDTFISSWKTAVEFADEVNRDNFGLVVDTYHVWPEYDLLTQLERDREKVFAVHVSDWPVGGPRCFGDRSIPGRGVIDLAGIFRCLQSIGYDRAMTIEIFSDRALPDSLWAWQPTRLVDECLKAATSIWDIAANSSG